MKLLLCLASIEPFKKMIEAWSPGELQSGALPFLYHQQIFQHDVTICETGYGDFQTAYKITRALTLHRSHLALKLSLGNAYLPELACGQVVNIVNEKPGDNGLHVQGEWKDLYDLELIDRKAAPQVRGAFINLTNAYMNVFLPYKKVVGLTVHEYACRDKVSARREKYQAACETGDGLAFVYACLFEKQSYYHLAAIEENLVSGEKNTELAVRSLQHEFENLMHKL